MKNSIQKISIVGFGNVGFHLSKAFSERGILVSHIYSTQKGNSNFPNDAIIVDDLASLPNDQLVLICVPDDAIASVIDQIPSSCPVAYTSGSVNLNCLPHREKIGVFYPLQTFSKNASLNVFEIPFFIEGNNQSFAQELFDLAWKISRKVNFANSEDRGNLHIAAVFVNNFTNHLNYIAQNYLEEKNLDFNHLKPLLEETVKKLEIVSPKEAQTGPARRGDLKIIEEHLSKLSGDTKEIYQTITNSILASYKHEKL